MSADNAIAILITTDQFWEGPEDCYTNMGEGTPVYRVTHIQNPEAFDEYRTQELHNLGYWMHSVFGKAPCFKSKKEAMAAAIKRHDEIGYTEYGIITYDATDYNFPGC